MAQKISLLFGEPVGLTDEQKREMEYARQILVNARRAKATAPDPYSLQKRNQFSAFGGGVSDALTFGGGDYLSAGAQSVFGGGLDGLGRRFDEALAAQREQDAYDAAHFRLARTSGQVAGTVAQLAALGPADGIVGAGLRMKQAAPMIAREYAALGGVGGALGAGSQALADFSHGRRGTLGDYVGATVGGVAGAVAGTRLGAGHAGATAGAVTSIAQDLANGRNVDWLHAGQSAAADGVLAGIPGVSTRLALNRLPIRTKGKIGDALSQIRTIARGDLPGTAQVRTRLGSGRHTVLDFKTRGDVPVEAKYGPKASLSGPQREAYRTLPRYRVDHFLPKDVGSIFGIPIGILGGPFLQRNGAK